MTSKPREIGTLIVVVLKARNLPNKRHIGKQDPYCTVVLDGEKKRTKAIKRGGQHPEWDEELRFTIYEDPDDDSNRNASEYGDPPTPPPKVNKGPPKIKGGASMAIACYAEDPRAADLIGEGNVDLTEVLTKGETDEWFTLTNKERYCGEVYLELTFWSNELPPVKKTAPKAKKQYGGPGSFVSAADDSIDGHPLLSRELSTGTTRESLPPSLRSHASGQVDLYVPPYQSVRSHISTDSLATEFAELSVDHTVSRRQSLPNGFDHRQSLDSHDQSRLSHHSSQVFHHNAFSEGVTAYQSEPNMIASDSYLQNPYARAEEPSQQQYDPNPPPSNYQTTVRQPRYSIPTSSSGFMPIPTPAPSGFAPLSSRPSLPSGYPPPTTPTPTPTNYGSQQSYTSATSSFAQIQPQSTGFSTASSSLPPSGSYNHSLSIPPPQSGYNDQSHTPPRPPSTIPPQPSLPTPAQMAQMAPQPYAPPLPQTPTPPQQYPPPPLSQQYTPPQHHQQYSPQPPQQYAPSQYAPAQPAQPFFSPPPFQSSVPPQSHLSVQQEHQMGKPATPSPPHHPIPPPPPLHNDGSPPVQTNPSSRPLPQPQLNKQPVRRQSSLPIPPGPPGMVNPPTSQAIAFPVASVFNSVPPPPPLQQPTTSQPAYLPSQITNPGPPPPLPPSTQPRQPPTRRPSLPVPPVNYAVQGQQQPVYQPLPPPPAMPHHPQYSEQISFPTAMSQSTYPMPPLRPPMQMSSYSQYMHTPPQMPDGAYSAPV